MPPVISNCFFGEKPDFSNFDKSKWDPRIDVEHRSVAEKYSTCKTRSAQKEIEREYGIRYTALLELPYFDPVRMCVVDPMHNLLLGTAKHITEIWKATGVLSAKDFDTIQERVDSMVTPTDIGRIPFKRVHCRAVEELGYILFFICSEGYPTITALYLLAHLCKHLLSFVSANNNGSTAL
jgi:hypothetical protein